ncbi:hypothetical protein H1W37_07165 [Stappia taiwanensis]|uniref:Uncharacterized protein n=1 Tax=Stappia taiwanensis TaxID=992267 RepID=A0A838XWZ4_9HYPH|nr:hypothetical protein [Stappia taiwanensis]MBA4611423.1 hypothetical protein [Stappia taiwanensis]
MFATTRQILTETLRVVSSNPILVVKVCGAWTVLSAMIFLITGIEPDDYLDIASSFQLLHIPLMIILMIGLTSGAVTWIRAIQLNEDVFWVNLNLNSRYVRLFIIYSFVTLISFGSAFTISRFYFHFFSIFYYGYLLKGGGSLVLFLIADNLCYSFYVFIFVCFFVLFHAPSSLVVPAISLGRNLTISQSVKLSQGARFSIFVLTAPLFLSMKIAILFSLRFIAVIGLYSPLGILFLFLVFAILHVGSVVYVTLLTRAYFLLRERQANAAQQAQPPV